MTGKHFIGRKDSCTILGNLLSNGVFVSMPLPKPGRNQGAPFGGRGGDGMCLAARVGGEGTSGPFRALEGPD